MKISTNHRGKYLKVTDVNNLVVTTNYENSDTYHLLEISISYFQLPQHTFRDLRQYKFIVSAQYVMSLV